MVKKIVDANVILRFLLHDDDEQFTIAKSFFDDVKIGWKGAVILESVLVETVYVLLKVYKVPKKEIAEALKNLLSFKGIANKDKEEFIEALNVYNYGNNLSIVDCLIYVKSKKLKTDILTFDKDLKKYKGTY